MRPSWSGPREASFVEMGHAARCGWPSSIVPVTTTGRSPRARWTAVREVEEETGLRCKLVAPLGCTAYADHKGRDKVACYWLMDVVGGRFRAGTEVDEVRWVTVDEAADLLSYRRDRALLRALDDLEATG